MSTSDPHSTSKTGKVSIVGAGPGAIAYLTLRGYELLTQAEVLLYDALVSSDFLQEVLQVVPPGCLAEDVGKRGGQPSQTQSEINRLLVHYCQQGKQVVRLKGGDPFIYGRTASEIQALREAGCAFEVIPGISSALAAPLLAGIPLTDPVLSRSFAVVSAHDPDVLDWPVLARMETLVILMGGRHLPEILHRLLSYGRSPKNPIAIVRWAGLPEQHVWVGTLATIQGQIAESLPSETPDPTLAPAVIVIGEVVRLREYLLGCS